MSRNFSNNSFLKTKSFGVPKSKTWMLLLPFIILTILTVVLPAILIIIKSFIPVENYKLSDNWNFLNGFILGKVLYSLLIAFATTIVCLIIAFPFAYFLAQSKNKIYKIMVIFIATAPIWTSFLVKLIGLKSFFDLMYGYQNATYGSIFTIIGLVYLYMPFMILPIFNVLNNMPSNLNLASMDLGRKPIDSFFYITIPYAKTSIMSGVSLVFLPSLTTVAVPQFLNNSPSGTMIGDIIVQEGSLASSSAISLARASTLSLVMCLVIVGGFSLIIFLKKIIKKIKSHEKI